MTAATGIVGDLMQRDGWALGDLSARCGPSHRVNACSSCALFIDDRPFKPRCLASLRSWTKVRPPAP